MWLSLGLRERAREALSVSSCDWQIGNSPIDGERSTWTYSR
jgi:hypothetical protein